MVKLERLPSAAAGHSVTQSDVAQRLLQRALAGEVCDAHGVYWAMNVPGIADVGDVSAPPPAPPKRAADGAKAAALAGPYRSPLLVLRGYRLSPLYRQQQGMKLSSATYANRIDALRPLCPFDLAGECRDTTCPYQHDRDYRMADAAIVQVGCGVRRSPCRISVRMCPTRRRRRPSGSRP